jgi:hypothetical protein
MLPVSRVAKISGRHASAREAGRGAVPRMRNFSGRGS